MIERADKSEARDGRINTDDADAGNSDLESTGKTTSRGDEENTVVVAEDGVVSGQDLEKETCSVFRFGGGRLSGNKAMTAWHQNMKIGDG